MRAAADNHPATALGSRLVLVEDNPADARLVEEMVLGEGRDDFELTCLTRLSEARSHLASEGAACVLLDLSLPDAVGLEGVEALRTEFVEIPIVIITGLDDEDTALKALHAGAQDYLIKGQIGETPFAGPSGTRSSASAPKRRSPGSAARTSSSSTPPPRASAGSTRREGSASRIPPRPGCSVGGKTT